MIKQVRFHSWGTGPKGYWRDISAMAAFVAARLQHPNPRCNGLNPRVSTIKVDQYKEKFGQVRIYCRLANEIMVQARWTEDGHAGAHTEDYAQKCFISDAIHYRRCYRDMVAMVPHLEGALCGGADYHALLYEDATYIDSKVIPNAKANSEYYLGWYQIDSFEALREMLVKIYARTERR